MTAGVVDTTVIVHLFRRNSLALQWYAAFSQPLHVTPITWMEIIYGAGSKEKLAKCKTVLSQFSMEYLTPVDMDWSIQQMERYRLRDGITTNDCLIASVCHQLQVPIYTDNVKDYLKILPAGLVVKPY